MFKKRFWLTSMVTMIWLVQLMSPVLAAPIPTLNQIDPGSQSGAKKVSSQDYSIDAKQSNTDVSKSMMEQYQVAYHQGLMDALENRPQQEPDQELQQAAYRQGFLDGIKLRSERAAWQAKMREAQKAREAQTDQNSTAQITDKNNQHFVNPGTDQKDDQNTSDQSISNDQVSANQPIPTKLGEAADNDQADPILCPTKNQARFIAQLGPLAQKIGQEHDLYASVLIAQAALESNWGTSELSRIHHNLFGIKGTWHGRGVSMTTQECFNGHPSIVAGIFKSYMDEKASLNDYVAVLDQPMYAGVHRKNAGNYRIATSFLKGRYATDPMYDQKLNQIIAGYRLTQFDRPIIPNDRSSAGKSEIVSHHRRPHSGSTLVESTMPHSAHRGSKKVNHHTWLPVAGGIGSVGVLEVLRRLYG